jgi:hypothetical protein
VDLLDDRVGAVGLVRGHGVKAPGTWAAVLAIKVALSCPVIGFREGTNGLCVDAATPRASG